MFEKDDGDLFTDSEKLIFRYTIGRGADRVRQYVFGDPLAIWNRLVKATDGQADEAIHAIYPVIDMDPLTGKELPETAGQASRRAEAEERLLAAVHEAFGMLPFDPATGTGAVSQDCWSAFNSYLRWVAGELSGDGNEPAGSASSAGQPAVPSLTGSTSGSGSTSAGATFGSPITSAAV
jgi:hypothetical protein